MDLSRLWELLVDTDSVPGLLVTTAAILLLAGALRLALVPLVRRRHRDDPYRRYWAGKLVTYALAAVAVVALVALWAPLGGRLSVILGFATAGIAFAMQEVIGALFGWVNVLAGRIYTVGDRIEIAGVRGDVIDITPLRTTLFEIGTDRADGGSSWVSARQPTGRVVAISNRKTFTEPVFNFSAHLDWIWEELVVAVPQDADWPRAEQVVLEEVRAYAPELRREGEVTLARLGERYLLADAQVEPQTFVRVAQGDVEVVARFVVAVRAARMAKDGVVREVLRRLADEGIPLAYPTYAVTGDVRAEVGDGTPGAG